MSHIQWVEGSLATPYRIGRTPEGKWIGIMSIALPTGGVVRLCAVAHESVIRDALTAAYGRAMRAPATAGDYGRTWGANSPWHKQARDLSWWIARFSSGRAPSADTDAGRTAWWRGLSKDARQLGRRRLILYWREGQGRGRVASGHIGNQRELATWAQWFVSLPKSERDRLYNTHAPDSSVLDDIGSAAKNVGRGLASTVSNVARGRIKQALGSLAKTALAASPMRLLPATRKIERAALGVASKIAPAVNFVPGVGPLVAPIATTAARQLAQAAQPKRAVSAARLMQRATAGVPSAQRAVRGVTALARQGNPQARQLAALLAQVTRLLQGQGGGATAGRWVTTTSGAEVFVPNAMAGGPGLDYLWDQMRPRFGYRDDASALTRRRAYRAGLAAMQLRR